MSLSAHDRQELDVIEERLATADPQLAGLLATFSRLADGEEIPAREEIPADEHRAVRRAFRGMFPCWPATPGSGETTERHRLLQASAVGAWLAISGALIAVAILLSHPVGNRACTYWVETGLNTTCVTHPPPHPQTAHAVKSG